MNADADVLLTGDLDLDLRSVRQVIGNGAASRSAVTRSRTIALASSLRTANATAFVLAASTIQVSGTAQGVLRML